MSQQAAARQARNRLTRNDVVAAALLLTRKVGLSGLTMRGLADALGVTPMAAYHWVDSKRALVDLVLEAVQEEIAATPRAGAWRDRLTTLATASRTAMLAYPGVGAALLAAPAGTRARELMQEARGLLGQAGFEGERLDYAWSTYHAFMLGQFAAAGSDASFDWGLALLLDALESAAGELVG